ncbi:MAG: DUF3392 family protein [Myxococcota bacterium]|nr:DUF3392 family protein [Myxococcota bacterium]
MRIDLGALDWLSGLASGHLSAICFGVMATLLAIFGQDLNRWVRRLTRELHFVWRMLAFVFLCAVGYGWLTVQAAPFLADVLRLLPTRLLSIVVVVMFLGLGLLAERKRKI